MEHSLKGKKVLFFYLTTFNYENEIKWAMEREGATVDAFNERPSNGTVTRVFLKFNRNLISQKIESYYNNVINETSGNKYDFIFFIKGESISKRIVAKLREVHPEAKIILYLWDSAVWNKNAYTMLGCFDKVITFDRKDSQEYKLQFLPLFYIPQYRKVAENKTQKVYDAMFVGTVHSERYEFINRIVKQIESLGGKCFTWFYFPSKLSFFKLKWNNKRFRGANIEDFKFVPLKREILLDNYSKTLIQLDLHDPLQRGLTMRTIETLGAKKKLITTNVDVIKYDFFCPENILVVDRYNPLITKEFLDAPWKEIPEEIYKKYSISSWLNTIFA